MRVRVRRRGDSLDEDVCFAPPREDRARVERSIERVSTERVSNARVGIMRAIALRSPARAA
jgi:hypothetical protein